MKNLYCSQCHLPLKMYRKAMPKYATIVELVEPHTCLDVPAEFNFKPAEPIKYEDLEHKQDRVKFDQKLMDLKPKGFGSVSTADLRDRRFEGDAETKTKSSAPGSILSMIDSMANSTPTKSLTDLPSED